MKVFRYLNHMARFSDKSAEAGISAMDRIEDAYRNGLKTMISISTDDHLKKARDDLAHEQFKSVF